MDKKIEPKNPAPKAEAKTEDHTEEQKSQRASRRNRVSRRNRAN